MAILPKLIRLAFSNRLRQIDKFRRNPLPVQQRQLDTLLAQSQHCRYLRRYDSSNLPIVKYEDIAADIGLVLGGEQNLLSSNETRWFAKSSGTTNDKSKFIPITRESLQECHFRGGRDLIAITADNYPTTNAFSGKALTLGGSHNIVNHASGILCGDLSAIMIENTPSWFRNRRVPSPEVALISDFDTKVKRICLEAQTMNVTSFAGVPSWNLVMMNRILEHTGKSNIHQVWPSMSLFAHGGISFTPYRDQYQKLFPDPRMIYVETYNASEGFFAIQDDPKRDDMLLMLDYGIYYEFLPLNKLDDHSALVPLEGVATGINYAMIITTNGGLWRYMIGDTIEFTSTDPYKIRITGRTKQFINAFGEELIVDNATRALDAACTTTGALIKSYTVAPVFMEGSQRGRHQWLIEFETSPSSIELFTTTLDTNLQNLNSDYEAKRQTGSTMDLPLVTIAAAGTFMRWMHSRGKVGGQNKIPCLANDRTFIDEILKIGSLSTAQ